MFLYLCSYTLKINTGHFSCKFLLISKHTEGCNAEVFKKTQNMTLNVQGFLKGFLVLFTEREKLNKKGITLP